METAADAFGILYASLAGYETDDIISPSNSFISDYYDFFGIPAHGSPANASLAERQTALMQRLGHVLDNLPLFDFGVRFYAIGKYDAAIALLERFVRQYPAREVFNNIGLCYYQKALRQYALWKRETIDRDVHLLFRVSAQIDPVSRFQQARSEPLPDDNKLFLKFIDKAIANFEEAKARDSEYETTLNNLGCAKLIQGKIDFAKAYFKEAIARNANSKQAHNNLGVAYFIEGKAQAAREHFLAARRIDANFGDALYNLGQYYLKKNNTEKAQK